jgi:hypothetical protein
MNILLTTANVYEHPDPAEWLKLNSKSFGINCVDDPEFADIIIFAETHPSEDPYFRNVINHPLYKKYRRKCVLYHDADLSVTTIPTISPSIEAWQFDAKHKRSFHYIARMCDNDTINIAILNYQQNRKYLYSFVGSRTHKIRNKLFDSKHPVDAFLNDTTGFKGWELSALDKILYERNYYNISDESYFILAPRGIGPCTYRLFETMQIGRVPVIISDEWIKIPGIDWESFTITIPESQIDLIPQILNERKKDAVEMGKIARKNWEEHFSPDVSLYKISMAAKELLAHKYSIKDSLRDHAQFFIKPWHLKNLLRSKKNQFKNKVAMLGIFG